MLTSKIFILTGIFLFITSGTYWKGQIDSNPSTDIKLVRGPYLQTGTPTSMIIKWRTNQPTDSRVIYGTNTAELNNMITDDVKTTEHIIFLDSLKTNTKYYYNIGNSEVLLFASDPTYYFITSPEIGYNKPIRIWAIGDFGSGDEEAQNVRTGYMKYRGDKHTDVWLMLGDMAYFFGEDDEFQKGIFGGVYNYMIRNTVIWPTPGNHDMRNSDSNTQTGPYYEVFTLPKKGEAGGEPSGTEAYYSFNYGDIHFISMDSDDTQRDKHGAMANWLKKDLKHDDHKWKIAFFHHPPYTKGTHDSDSDTDSNGRMKDMRENFLPILEKHGVDMVLSGHSHIYERSYLIHGHYGYSRDFDPDHMIIRNSNEKKKNKTTFFKQRNNLGTVYVVCGMSGSRPSAGTCNHPAMAVCQSWNRGSVAIEVIDNVLHADFVDEFGKIRDSFDITKAF